jgi:hypothetical protein
MRPVQIVGLAVASFSLGVLVGWIAARVKADEEREWNKFREAMDRMNEEGGYLLIRLATYAAIIATLVIIVALIDSRT